MFVPFFIDDINQRCQCGGFTASGRSRDKDKPTLFLCQPKDRFRHPEILRCRDITCHDTQYSRIGTSLVESVDTEPSHTRIRVGKVHFPCGFHGFFLFFVKHGFHQFFGHRWCQFLKSVHFIKCSADPALRPYPHGNM